MIPKVASLDAAIELQKYEVRRVAEGMAVRLCMPSLDQLLYISGNVNGLIDNKGPCTSSIPHAHGICADPCLPLTCEARVVGDPAREEMRGKLSYIVLL